jgi:hypothetical protein
MIKQEILDALAGKFFKIGGITEAAGDTALGLKLYQVIAYDKTPDGELNRRDIGFYVENEGEANEVAYWKDNEPKKGLSASVAFTHEVRDYISSKIADKTIVGGFIENTAGENEVAVVTIYKQEASKILEKRILVNRDSLGNLQHQAIG